VTLDNLSLGHDWAVQWGPLEKGDVGDCDFVRGVIRKHEIQAVIHFAAYAYVGESVSNPRKYFQNNLVCTLNLLNAMLDCGVKAIVFSSTCATYGAPVQVPIAESHPQHPINPYGEAKYFVERVLHWYGAAYGLRWAALRYFNAAGADPDGAIGEDHDPETHLIPLVIWAAQGRRSHVDIYGTDYPTPDGTAIRDYIHVLDLAEAHTRALQHLLDGKGNLALNLGTGAGHSVREVIAAVERVGKRKVPAKETARRPGDPPALVADARQANVVLGWKPRYMELDRIVEDAWRWHAKH
jgi:UDP-glucose-4-epimerase GalE